MQSKMRLAAVSFLMGGLVACGGGGGGSSDGATSMTVSGVAATGAPIAGGEVEVKCASGNGTATTQANGSYSVAVPEGALPCVIRVTKEGASLHSIVETGATLPATANVTPLTELLVAQIAGAPAASLFNSFDATAQALLTATAVSTASGEVIAALSNTVDFGGDDLLRGTLVPAVNGDVGNLLDQKLDALARALEETGTTIGELSDALVANPGEPPAAFADVPAAATSCPSLRTGTYWGLEAEDPQFSADPAQLDARALTITYGGEDEPVHLTPVENEPCRFTISDDGQIDGTEEVVVSRAGVIVTRFPEDGVSKPTVGFPKQTVTQAELVGDWNYVGWVGSMSDMTPVHGSFTLNASGEFSNIANYVGMTLEDEPPGQELSLVRDATTGAFNQIVNGVTQQALFLPFRTPDGRIVLVGNPQDGPQGLIFATKRTALTLPTVGSISRYWEFELSAALGGFRPVVAQSTTITAAEGANITRRRPALGTAPERLDTLQLNQPRAGMRTRSANACTTANLAPMNCAGMVQLPLPGAGITVAAGLAPNTFFTIAVSRP